MKASFGIHIPTHGSYSYESVLRVAAVADSLGYSHLWIGDHFYLPSSTYSKIGGEANRPDKLEAWTTLAAIAAKTRRIKIGTRVSPLPFYQPARLAKMVTTVDIISGGRANLGAGAAWFREEAVSYGIGWWSHKERMLRMLEALEIVLRLWKEERTTYSGKYYQVEDAPFWPKPIQKPHPPIWFGGTSKAILEATAKYGSGLLPPTDSPLEKLRSLTSKIREAEGRSGKTENVIVAPSLSYPHGVGEDPSEWHRTIESFLQTGASSIMIDFSQSDVPPQVAVEFLDEFAEKVLPQY